MAHPFTELAPEYEHDLAILEVTKPKEVDAIARRLMSGNAIPQYSAVQHQLGIPIPVQASICERESSGDFSRSPAQGDRWDKVSVNVPRGHGPYDSWYAAAIDAWSNLDHLNKNIVPWSIPYAMYEQEGFNGFGYRAHGVRSPYLLGGTNLQQPGRYAGDHNFVHEMDTQIGTVPIMLRMIELMPSLAFGPTVAKSSGTLTPSLPVPAGVGGTLAGGVETGTKWLQDSLNKLMLPTGDHLVVDGNFGRHTRNAVRAFQSFVGITADGLIGDETCSAIDAALVTIKGTSP